MERGGGFHRFRKHAKTSSALSIQEFGNSSITTSPNNNGNDNNNTEQTQQDDAREQDQYMPIANVIRIMRRILLAHAKISDDAKETIQECVSEFISFVTGEANERCQCEQRKTITAEDVLWAMGKLGFDNYVELLSLYLGRYRESENDRSSLHGESIAKRGMDYRPLRMAGMAGMVGMLGAMPGIGAYGLVLPIDQQQQELFDVAAMGGYYKDESNAGGSSSQTATANFDPFAQFK